MKILHVLHGYLPDHGGGTERVVDAISRALVARGHEVVVVGGHLDCWDVGEGAHDDGAGCMQAVEALRILKDLGLRPRRTLRCVLFANEENGLGGGRAHAAMLPRRGVSCAAAREQRREDLVVDPRGDVVPAVLARVGAMMSSCGQAAADVVSLSNASETNNPPSTVGPRDESTSLSPSDVAG